MEKFIIIACLCGEKIIIQENQYADCTCGREFHLIVKVPKPKKKKYGEGEENLH